MWPGGKNANLQSFDTKTEVTIFKVQSVGFVLLQTYVVTNENYGVLSNLFLLFYKMEAKIS